MVSLRIKYWKLIQYFKTEFIKFDVKFKIKKKKYSRVLGVSPSGLPPKINYQILASPIQIQYQSFAFTRSKIGPIKSQKDIEIKNIFLFRTWEPQWSP